MTRRRAGANPRGSNGNGYGESISRGEQVLFLPGALALREAPPSPLGRKLQWLFLVLFAIALLWSYFGRVDIVASAQGRVIPGDRIKIIQSALSGKVARLLVADGQAVDKGEILLSLDTTAVDAEIARLTSVLAQTRHQLAWRMKFDEWLISGGQVIPMQDSRQAVEGAGRIHSTGAVLHERVATFSGEVLRMEKQLSALQAKLDANRAENMRGHATLEVLRQRVAAYETLVRNRHGARIQFLELLQQQTDLERSLPSLAADRRKLRNEANALKAGISAFIGGTRGDNLEAITRLESEKRSTTHELEKLIHIREQHDIEAPVAGTVEEMQVHTVGGVLSPGQAIMKIVPEDVVLEVDALLENRDIGFVLEGQAAEVKIETFNFTRYGVIPATVRDISEDAIDDGSGTWRYRIRLGLERQDIAVGDRLLKLSPGMTATVEVKTGSRRVIEFLLAPLLRYRHESIRER